MDFHSLTRKELQTLCKNNKIPANMTNIAMADALKALDKVEGLEELLSQSRSPEKTTKNLSQEIPSTVNRTSTRRKPTKQEPQSNQLTTRTRRIARKTIEFNEENTNVNVPEAPPVVTTTRKRAQKNELDVAEQKKDDLPETPALRSGRRRARVGMESTMRKVEAAKEESVQRGNGTRRSVRLLENCMAGLSLKESGKLEPVKVSGTLSEVPLARNLSASLEDEKDLKKVQESSEGFQNGENGSVVISEFGTDQIDNLAEISNKTKDPKGSNDIAVTEELSDTHNTNQEPLAVEPKPAMVAEAVETVSKDILDQASPAKLMKHIEVQNGEDCDVNVVINHDNDGVGEHPQDEVFTEDTVSQAEVFPDSSENVENEVYQDYLVSTDQLADSDIDDNSGFDSNSIADEITEELPCETATYCSENLMTDMVDVNVVVQDNHDNVDLPELQEDEEYSERNASLVDSEIDDDSGCDNNSFADELPEELPCETASYCSMNLMAHMVNEEALVDVNVSEVEVIHVAETSLPKATQSADKTPDHADAEALFDVSVKPAEELADITLQATPPLGKSPTAAAKQISPSPYLASDIAVTSSIPLSPQLTRLTPMKSLSKNQTTIPKMTQFSENKENTENNYVKEVVEPVKMKKTKNVINKQAMQNLDNMSLRYLKKLTRKLNNLQIFDDVVNKEDNNSAENCMHAGETERKN